MRLAMLKLRGRHGFQAMAKFIKFDFSRDSDRMDSVRITDDLQNLPLTLDVMVQVWTDRPWARQEPLASTAPTLADRQVSR